MRRCLPGHWAQSYLLYFSNVNARKQRAIISKSQKEPGTACPTSIVSTSPQSRGNGSERKMVLRIVERESWARAGMEPLLQARNVNIYRVGRYVNILRPHWYWEGHPVPLRIGSQDEKLSPCQKPGIKQRFQVTTEMLSPEVQPGAFHQLFLCPRPDTLYQSPPVAPLLTVISNISIDTQLSPYGSPWDKTILRHHPHPLALLPNTSRVITHDQGRGGKAFSSEESENTSGSSQYRDVYISFFQNRVFL